MAEQVVAERLHGRFVVEVGVRQAWPFVTLCDTTSEPATELRLYIDTAFRIEPGPVVFDEGDPNQAAIALLDLNNRTVTDVQIGDSYDLTMTFDGDQRLVISGTPASFTTQAAWWLSEPVPV